MKLSDAIVLGSTQIKLNPCYWLHSGGECGCLLGMAERAVGQQEWSADRLHQEWPWFTKGMEVEISRMAVRLANGGMTLEQVLQKVRQWEPAEEPQAEPTVPAIELELVKETR